MTTHPMKLNDAPFAQIAGGAKTVECRLFDEKRQQVQLGDTITFTNTSDENKTITVKVVGLLRYATFADMFARNDPAKFGGYDAASLTSALLKYYSLEEQSRFGVLGIEFELVERR